MTNGVTIPVEQFVIDRVAEVEARFNIRLEAAEAAKKLQAAEYERRLTDLNHAHALAAEVQQTFAPKGMVEREFAIMVERISNLERAKADRDGSARIIAAIIGFAAAAAVALLMFFADKAWK